MALAISGGAEADKAIKGALVSALRPPMLLKDVLKSEPLSSNAKTQLKQYFNIISSSPTIQVYNEPHLLPPMLSAS